MSLSLLFNVICKLNKNQKNSFLTFIEAWSYVMKKYIRILCIVGLLVLQLSFNPTVSSLGSLSQSNDPRSSVMTIQIVFVGINSSFIDQTLLKDELTSQLTGIPYSYLGVDYDLSGIGTIGMVQWNFQFVFTSTAFSNSVKNVMQSSATYNNISGNSGEYIPTSSLESWFSDATNYNSQFSLPTNGYTLIFGNFSSLGNHWLTDQYYEYDSHQYINRSFLNEFDVSRMLFVDLSIQNSYLTIVGSDGPIQNLIPYSPTTSHGSLMIAQYFFQWTTEIITDLFYSNLLYSTPNFYQTYDATNINSIIATPPNTVENIKIFLLNNITGTQSSDYNKYINATLIENSFKDLLPWYNWNISIINLEVSNYPALAQKLVQSYDPNAPPVIPGDVKGGVDLNNVFDWVYNQISSGNYTSSLPFLNSALGSNTYPIFAFTFDSGYFGSSYKGNFYSGIEGASLFSNTASNATTGSQWSHLTFIAQDAHNFNHTNTTQVTEGFTHLIIHETGHAVGLTHTFGYSEAASMAGDPMSYITYNYYFSQFKKDQVQRGEIYQALYYGLLYLQPFSSSTITNSTSATNDFNTLATTFNQISTYFNKMDYISAYNLAWSFYTESKQFYSNYQSLIGTSDPGANSLSTTLLIPQTSTTSTTNSNLYPESTFILLTLGIVSVVAVVIRKKLKKT